MIEILMCDCCGRGFYANEGDLCPDCGASIGLDTHCLDTESRHELRLAVFAAGQALLDAGGDPFEIVSPSELEILPGPELARRLQALEDRRRELGRKVDQ